MNPTQQAITNAYILLEGCNHSARYMVAKLEDIGIEVTQSEIADICRHYGVSTKEPPRFQALKAFSEEIADPVKPAPKKKLKQPRMKHRSLSKPPSKAVINDKGERYESLRAANIAAGYSHGSGAIHGCLKSGRPDKNGNTWRYADGA